MSVGMARPITGHVIGQQHVQSEKSLLRKTAEQH